MSHLRPLFFLASRIIATRPIAITFLVANVEGIYEKLVGETKCYQDSDCQTMGLIRIIAVGDDYLETEQAEYDSLRELWQMALNEFPLRCGHTKTIFPALPRPSFVALDGFQLGWFREIRTFGSLPPVFQWLNMSATALLRIAGPPRFGPMGNALLRFRDGRLTIDDILGLQTRGDVLKLPGLPPMYDWEFHPEEIPARARANVIEKISRVAQFVREADGFVTSWSAVFEGQECLDEFESYSTSIRGRLAFHLGPLLPLVPGEARLRSEFLAAQRLNMPLGRFEAIGDFLDQVGNVHGPGSLMYISFGSEHWPSSTDAVRLLLATLGEKRIPYVLAHSRAPDSVVKELRNEFEKPGDSLFTDWTPQQYLLSHKACGVFLTHGGVGSALESAALGVPMIFWPFPVDQADLSAHVTHYLKISWELREVRTGVAGRMPILATGQVHGSDRQARHDELVRVIEEAFGHEGKEKRARARKLAIEMGASWALGGLAERSFSDFLAHITSLES